MSAKATNARTPNSNSKLYSPKVLVRAFGYYAKSRSLYHQLRKDFKLPLVRTLQKVTSKCSKQSKLSFLANILRPLNEKQKVCALLHDEIYIKKMMQYANQQTILLYWRKQLMLGCMVNCLHGGPKFLLNMIPIAKLNSDFFCSKK